MLVLTSTFTAINCRFASNTADSPDPAWTCGGGAVYGHSNSELYLYHCTFDKNQAINGQGGAIYTQDNTSTLYSYNSIYTGNTEDGIVSEAGQIRGTISGNGKNLIENGTTVTRDLVFGNNQYENGYIMPLAFARSATPLTAFDIEVPEGMNAEDIISWLLKDQRGEPRSSDTVTYGAVEFDGIGIREDGSFDVLVLPNITDRAFNIIFDNPETQTVSIELLDLEGKTIFTIHEGTVNSGIQVYRVNENLASGFYFVKFVFKNKVMILKVIVRK